MHFYGKLLFVTLLVLVMGTNKIWGQMKSEHNRFTQYLNHPWVDSVFQSLEPEERLAQLFMVAAYSNRDEDYQDELVRKVTDYKLGGVIFFQGGPVRQAKLTNRLQKHSNVPLLVAMDAEWGLKMRLDSTTRFPYAMALGAVRDPHLIYNTGAAIAEDCKRLGVHINFAPVLDINNNPDNPVINFRSFGENKQEVLWRGFEYARGLEDNGVMAVGKHFPGHGDTDTDSHLDLPVIDHNRKRLDALELFPFRFAIDNGIGGMMVAHLNVPALDTSGVPTTLSSKTITKLLKEEMGFEGLAFTDALNMKGVAKYYEPGEVDLKALKAGNDVLLFSEDVPRAIGLIMKEVENGTIDQEYIDKKCRKVLAAKYWAGLNDHRPVKTDSLVKELNTPQDKWLNYKLAEAALTVLENKNSIVPVRKIHNRKIAVVSVGELMATPFEETIEKYTQVDDINIAMDAEPAEYEKLKTQLNSYDLIIAGLHNMGVYPSGNFGVSNNATELLNYIANSGKGLITIFGNPYVLSTLDNIDEAEFLLTTYQESFYAQTMAAQLIFGAIGANGKLPITVEKQYPQGAGIKVNGIGRLKYTVPEAAGLDSRVMQRIDSLVNYAIENKAIPGCQVLIAKDGKVVWHKPYGFQTYDSTKLVELKDLYDLASVTKVAAATTALMKLYEEGKFDLEANLGDYLSYFRRGKKDEVTFREILAHQAGFKPWIPYWKKTVRNSGKFKWFTFKYDSSKRFPVKVADGLFLHRNYKKKIYKQIRKSEMGEKEYNYSGLSFYLFPEIIQKLSGQSFDEYLYDNFYKPLGANTLAFNPYKRFKYGRIVPTEYDSVFRKQLLHGTVHDEGAAMMGGLSANAGLFATSNDLAKLVQMWCNYGEYGGKRYLKESTVKEFTKCQYCENNDNRRGLGFDRPMEEPHDNGNTAKSVSQQSFGHSGFTGTFAWADPKHNIVYVFLSNRVYPTRENTKLYEFNTRTNIQQVIYDAMEKKILSSRGDN